MSHPCAYGGNHHDGHGGGLHEYRPDVYNALDDTKGAWVIYSTERDPRTHERKSLGQVDFCHACGARLPLAPFGQPLPDQEWNQ